MRSRCDRQTSIFFDNLTIYKLLESTLNDRVRTKNLLFWGCRFNLLNLGLHAYASAKTEQGAGTYISNNFKNAVATWCRGRPRDEGCVSLEILIKISSTCLLTFVFFGPNIPLYSPWVPVVCSMGLYFQKIQQYSRAMFKSTKAQFTRFFGT